MLYRDGQDKRDIDIQDVLVTCFILTDLTERIIGCAFEVQSELGAGFLEAVYEKAMVVALAESGVPVQAQAPIKVSFRGVTVGSFYADLLVGERVIVELKTVSQLSLQHRAQLINYLNATGIPVGLLINFDNPKLEYRRLTADPSRSQGGRGNQKPAK